MVDVESRKAYFRAYYRKNKDKYRIMNGKKIEKPKCPKKIKKDIPQFSITRGEYVVKFQ